MLIINPIKERILKQLARYKFLTISQLVTLGVGHTTKAREGTKELGEIGLTKHAQYATVTRKKGQAERIHFLTRKAVKIMIEELGYKEQDIRYPRSVNSIFKSDYFHRISTINTWIAFDIWAKSHTFETFFFNTYFDKAGSQRNQDETGALQSVTRIEFPNGQFFNPDAICAYKKPDGKTKLWIIEVWNGDNTKEIIERFEKIHDAIVQGLPADKYHLQVATRVLNTFEFDGNMKAVMNRMKQDPYFSSDWVANSFFFSNAESAKENFETCFVNLNNEAVLLSNV
jgi:hypothetical protein